MMICQDRLGTNTSLRKILKSGTFQHHKAFVDVVDNPRVGGNNDHDNDNDDNDDNDNTCLFSLSLYSRVAVAFAVFIFCFGSTLHFHSTLRNDRITKTGSGRA